tara:strand:+ start:363 stop:587 length:225 start_codon:yes stop_codon:yes gene_type:complete
MLLDTREQDFYIIYDSNDNNKVVGMLDSEADKDAHDALNPNHIKISTNTINSPIGECLYLHEVQVDSEGLATRV